MTEPKAQDEPNLPTINDTDVQTDLPPATDGSQEHQEASKTLPYMVTIGGNVYSVQAKDSTDAGKQAHKLYEADQKETK